MQALPTALNSGPAQSLQNVYYEPNPQDYFAHRDGRWSNANTVDVPTTTHSDSPFNPGAIRLISWNIDVLIGFAEERMSAALKYLDELVSATPPDVAIVIFLQEMGQSDLEQIQSSDWIKARFNITDLDSTSWLMPLYGTTTLVDRRLQIKNVFRVPWVSKFSRDGLFVDIALSIPNSYCEEQKILRLCNVHLESLVADPPVRPFQLAVAAEYLHEPHVASALIAGDFNAIQPFDRTLHTELKLRDSYLELGGEEDSDDGYTWGYQVPEIMRYRFGCCRMDKILLRGHIQPRKFERIGMGVKVFDCFREEVEKQIEGGWVTDHYGVLGDFDLTGGWKLVGYDPKRELA